MASSSRKRPNESNHLESEHNRPRKRRYGADSRREDASSILSRFAVNLSDDQKTKVLHFMIETTLQSTNIKHIHDICVEHRIRKRWNTHQDAFRELRSHSCSWQCLVRSSDAMNADEFEGDERVFDTEIAYATHLSDEEKTECLQFFLLNKLCHADDKRITSMASEHGIRVRLETTNLLDELLASLTHHACSSTCRVRADDVTESRKPLRALERKRSRAKQSADAMEVDEEDTDYWRDNWPQVEDERTHNKILSEFIDATSEYALRKEPCSFCNVNEAVHTMKKRDPQDLDISLLIQSTDKLRTICNQPLIQSHQLHDGRYNVCPSCWACVKGGKFTRLPTLSWANGCWIGSVPPQLSHLTYAEELVIARAHATKCWTKLNGSVRSKGPSAQRAASGNVCIHPHEITRIATHLPRPMSTLYDEIIVIFVSEGRPATADMFKETPLIVRRGYILRALQWLKLHNPLYTDVEIDLAALAEYPDDDDGHPNFPVQFQTPNATISGQSATYTGHGIDTTEAIFAAHDSTDNERVPISVTGTFDVDKTEASLNLRKINALKMLKDNKEFLKTSTSNETLNARDHPRVYGMLWPTLFPYGTGICEDNLHGIGGPFREVKLYHHVKHLLRLADRRFQTHLSFIFVMHNILMLRRSSYKSRLAVRRAWWPEAMSAMNKIGSDTLRAVQDEMLDRKARKDYTKLEPRNEAEEAVFHVLKYVEYIDDHIEGSTGEVTKMREEMRALSRQSGTPSIFFTLNPADAHNPITSFLAGHDIDLDAPFQKPDSRYTPFHRARILANNPIAGAQFFHTMARQFIDTLLGFKRKNRRGVFGRVKHYYGVIEAQNRGSLHLHILIWLEGALSPKQLQERCACDEAFKKRLFLWLESAFWHSLPPSTAPVQGNYEAKKRCLLGRPPHPNSNDFETTYMQYLREVLDASDQQHEHSDCCFKKTSRTMLSMTSEERDALCRFNLPAVVVEETFIDDNGRIWIKRLDGTMAGYNPIVSIACQCNTDGKFVGSGALGMALSIYMTNYTAKSSLDSAVVITALAAAISALKSTGDAPEDEESCRRLLMKTLNQMNGRRELSAQQVASSLLGFSNHLTDASFAVFYWTKTLHWLSPAHFAYTSKAASSDAVNDVERCSEEETREEDDDMVILKADDVIPPLAPLAYDILFRPPELEEMNMWDIMCTYEKCTKKRSTKTAEDSVDNTQRDDISLNLSPSHPQFATHVMRQRHTRHVPVLTGIAVPRRDIEDRAEQYAIAMLALFKPWRRDSKNPLKPAHASWTSVFADFMKDVPCKYSDIMDHMQEQWECRQAADDYSHKRRKGDMSFGNNDMKEADLEDEQEHGLEWQLGQEDVGGHYEVNAGETEDNDTSCGTEANGEITSSATEAVISLARASQLYATPRANVVLDSYANVVSDVGSSGRDLGQEAASRLAAERAAFTQRREMNQDTIQSSSTGNSSPNYTRNESPDLRSRLTTLEMEKEIARSRTRRHVGDDSIWQGLQEWQRTAIGICRVFTLNKKQRMAFLLIVNSISAHPSDRDRPPLRLIIGGPGGTGKSHIYDAVKLFQLAMSRPPDIAFTAPTGVAAANIGGSTIYSELSLTTKYDTLLRPNSKTLPKLSERLGRLHTIILDEFFFMGCGEFEKLSRYINLARRCTDDIFGHLNLIISGDHFQLSGPKITPLYNHALEAVASASSSLQPLSPQTRKALTGFKNYRSFDKCVVLDTIVRQKDPRFVALLNRLRRGICTVNGPDNDLEYLKRFQLATDSCVLGEPDVLKWVKSPHNAPPLITYTNSVRNAHNWNMTAAFASATGQDFHVYHAEDSIGRSSRRTVLSGQNARDAWNTSIKTNAHDLSGRLPLAIGMPIIVVDNIAVELGICNGSRGVLRGINYFTRKGRRYAVSVDVDILSYQSSDEENPHRITIPTVAKTIQYTSQTTGRVHSARRQQLPIIAGFAFTVHNSQSQSLVSAILHIESSRNTASTYVMLSRIKCGLEGPMGLRILGEVSEKNISTHAPEEVRREEERLQAMSERTIRESAKELEWFTATGEEL